MTTAEGGARKRQPPSAGGGGEAEECEVLPYDNRLAADLALAADREIEQSLERGGALTRRPWGEVSAVKTMVLDGFSGIAAAWQPILAKAHHKLTLAAVFCHSRPHVCFDKDDGDEGRCELADLLIVIDYKGPGAAVTDRRAVLVQAKLLKPDRITLSGNEWVQYELLSRWPPFEFVDARYDPRPRLLKKGTAPELAGEYGGIALGASPRAWTQFLTAPPKGVDSPVDLGGFLAQMALGAPVCGRSAAPQGNDDWSFTVRELLEKTAKLPIVKADDSILRGNVLPIGFLVGEAEPSAALMCAVHAGHYGPVPPGGSGGAGGEGDMEDEWPDGAISTVHVRISHVEAQPES